VGPELPIKEEAIEVAEERKEEDDSDSYERNLIGSPRK
jgi:hypothetical protein